MKLGFYFYLFYPLLVILLFQFSVNFVHSCGSRPNFNRRGKKPLYFKQRVPDSPEISLQASGKPQGKITRNSSKFNSHLVACYSTDIVFKDEERTGADRVMTKRCREKLKILASKVKQRWRGVKLRVTEAWDEDDSHSTDSLHYEGRAVDITTSDKDIKKYPVLGRLAVEAGFDWVSYEQKHRIHASVRADDDRYDSWGSCFNSHASVILESGTNIPIKDLKTGQKVQAVDGNGKVVSSEVLLFLDYNPWLTKVPFVVIETEAPATRLALTKNHLIFALESNSSSLDSAQAKLAQFVQLGDYVVVHSKAGLVASKVSSVIIQEKDGVVAPLTAHGTIIVDGVVASCYSEVKSHSISHYAFAPVRWLHHLAPALLKQLDMSGYQRGTHWFPRFLILLNRLLGVVEFA